MTIHNEPPPASTESSSVPSGLKRVVVASMAGTVVEWYEFFLYATAATLVFNKVFFAEGAGDKALIAALLTYAVGFVARPLGGVVFGHFGDKYGRKKLLQFSLLLVGAVTFLMGCLPTYGQIGFWAPILLVVLRFMQGFAVGGEWGGAVLLVAEHSPNRSRAFWASWPQAAVPVGNMLATVVLLVLTGTLSDAAFLSWGWRVAFWLSAVVVLVGCYIRTKVTDAPIFIEAQQEVERVKAVSYGVFEVLKRYPRGVFTAMGLRFAENIMYYLVVTFSIVYLKNHVGADTGDILWWLLAAHAVHFLVIPQVGRLSDRFGRRPVYIVGTVLAGTWGFFAFPLMNTANYLAIMAAVIIGLVIHAIMYAPQPAIMAEMFPTRMRYSGVSLGYQVTSIVAGSLAPAIATWLLGEFGAACARELAARGAVVTVADLDDVGARAVAEEIGGKAWAIDFSDVAALEELQLDADILVNNAGVQHVSPIPEFPPDRFRLMMALMVEAPFLLIRAALPHMYGQNFGRIINLSSVHGIRASEYKVAYVTAKHALEGLSKVTALEGGPHDVTSNCVNPGYVRTPLVTKQIADQARTHGIPEDQVVAEILLKESAIKRLVEPEEVAALVGWLASPAAGMVTGASYTMDGGWSAR